MRQFFITVLGTLVGLFLFVFLIFILLGGLIGSAASNAAEKNAGPNGEKILTLDLRQPLRDHGGSESIFGPRPISVVHIARTLDKAKNDPTVKGVFIRARAMGIPPASAEEIRSALINFKSSGKFVYTHSQGFEGTSIMGYYAVSASDEIWQQATSGFAAAGLSSETPFYGGVAEHFDAKADFVQFREYKSAANSYTQKDFTPEHRESTTSLLSSLYNTATDQIATDRGLDASDLRALFNTAPHSAEDALEAGLIDKLGYAENIRAYIKQKTDNEDIAFQAIGSYSPAQKYTGPQIAFIGGEGPVIMGKSQDNNTPFRNIIAMGGDTVSKAIDDAAQDERIKALIFRVSTPGGSATASDQINAAILRAKAAGKPVIISMGQYAASGGYYVSAHADKIIALPTTITGSIGVLGGKVSLENAYSKIGYNVERISIGGDYLGVYSGDTAFTDVQKEKFTRQMEDIYIDFTELVAEGRGLPIETVRGVAKGRVWTGEQARELGLVDELGGIMRAIEVAKDMAGIDKDTQIGLKPFPRPKPFAERLQEQLSGVASLASDLELVREIAVLPEVQNAVKARKAATQGERGALSANIPQIDPR